MELLIVIVVIAILAAISVVAYNGVQQRAINASNVQLDDAYRKLLLSYAAEHGAYPTFPQANSTNYFVCLGAGYPDANHDGLGDCVQSDSGVVQASAVTSVNDPLTEFGPQQQVSNVTWQMRNLPSPDDQSFVIGQVKLVYNSTYYLQQQSNPYWLSYIQLGAGNSCRSPYLATAHTGGGVEFDPASPTDPTYQSQYVLQPLKECYEPLPNPA